MEITIYALVNPFDGNPFYVGATSQSLLLRLRMHINDRSQNKGDGLSPVTQKNILICDIMSQGGKIEIHELERCDISDATERELFHYTRIKSLGFNLRQSEKHFNYSKSKSKYFNTLQNSK